MHGRGDGAMPVGRGGSRSVAPALVRTPRSLRNGVFALPSTRDGKRATWLGAGILGLFVFDAILAALGASDCGDGARLVLGVSGGLAMLGAIVSLVFAVRALRKGDRSIVLLWPLLLGVVAVMFVVGEFLSPR